MRRGRALALVAGAALACAVTAPAAHADPSSSARVRALAHAAADDPAALRALRRIDVVDGRRVDLAGALGGARGAALRARLTVLAAQAGTGGGPASGSAPAEARDILADDRFHQHLPQPLRRPLERLGRAIERLWAALPGGPGGRWGIAVVAAAVLAALLAARGIRRRGAAAPAPAAGVARAGVAADDGPDALERRAGEAEAAGDHALAVRLRFRAGLVRLGERDAIPYRPSLTTAEARRRLRSQPFDRLATDFEAIAYGGRPAGGADSDAARAGWRDVLAKAGRR